MRIVSLTSRFSKQELYLREGRLQAYYLLKYITPLELDALNSRQQRFKYYRGEIPHPYEEHKKNIEMMRKEYPELMANYPNV